MLNAGVGSTFPKTHWPSTGPLYYTFLEVYSSKKPLCTFMARFGHERRHETPRIHLLEFALSFGGLPLIQRNYPESYGTHNAGVAGSSPAPAIQQVVEPSQVRGVALFVRPTCAAMRATTARITGRTGRKRADFDRPRGRV